MNSTRNVLDRKALKMAFIESENRNLVQMVEDLQTTLTINKNIIKSLLDQKKGTGNNSNGAGSMDYTVSQLTHENEMLEVNTRRITEERDQL